MASVLDDKVKSTQPRSEPRWKRTTRGASLVVFSGAMLARASVCSADARGYGTHEQLGLPPCTFATQMGIACPGCGLTTSLVHAVHGEIGASLHAHYGGLPLAMALLWMCLLGVTEMGLGRPLRRDAVRRTHVVLSTLVAIGVATTAMMRWGH